MTMFFGLAHSNSTRSNAARRGGVEVFDDFHHGGGIEAGETLVAVNERAVQQAQTFLLNRRKAVVVQSVMGDFERAMRHVHADDFSELLFLQQSLEQSAFTATQVQNASRARAFQRGQHRAKTLFVEADVALDGFFFLRVNFGDGIGIRFALVHELRQRVVHQAALVLEIAARDGFALGMRRQPALAVAQKFFHLVIADPVVLVVVQHRHEHVKMREKLLQRQSRIQLDLEI